MMPISAKYKSDLQTLENCVDSGQFDRPMMEELFTIADEMAKVKPGSKDSLMLQGYLMSTLFYVDMAKGWIVHHVSLFHKYRSVRCISSVI